MRSYKFKKMFFILIVLILILNLIGCNIKTEKEDELNEKVDQEMQYVNTQLLTMINSLNNITVKNYSVVTEKSSQTESSSGPETGGTSEENEKSGSDSNTDSEGNDGNTTISKMQRESILTNNKDTDWDALKSDIEIFYSAWSPILLDLYKINVNKEDILNFNTTLDNTVIFIKNEDKTNSALALASLYSYIPKYIQSYSDDNLNINLSKIKSCIVNSYAAIEQDNWDEVSKQLRDVEGYFTSILNDTENNQKIYNINKAYVLFKELQNCLSTRDKDLFYIKYKNVMEELNIINQI